MTQPDPPTIRYDQVTYSAVVDHLQHFVDCYNRDHATGPNKMPTVILNDRKYRALDSSGQLKGWAAWHGSTMVAVLSYILSASRHYAPDYTIALHDFFYCLPEYRGGLVPLTLFRRAEADLWRLGTQKIFFVDHVRFLDRSAALKRMGWKPVEVTYEKDRPTNPAPD
jgi:hypothetical protein